MAEIVRSDTSSPDTDKDFDPSADLMVHDYDDERTLDEEEALTSGESCSGELDELQKESEMPIEDLLAQYAQGPGAAEELLEHSASSSNSSSEEEILESNDLTLDKEIISHDLLQNSASVTADRDISVNELIQNVSRSQTERLLRSTSNQGSDDSSSSSDDENYEPIEEHKKTIQVGSDFQAVIPSGLCVYGDAPAYENEDRLLWDPSKIKDENALYEYLCNVQREMDRNPSLVASIPRGKHIRDDEQALFLLLQCDNNIEEAERRRKMQAVPPTDVMSLWSEDECRNFEDGLRLYGKNFHEIHHNKVRTRSVFELVHFYYLWKKTERHDVFAAKTRAEKRKYTLNPGVIDHMDRFLEEQEVEMSQSLIPTHHVEVNIHQVLDHRHHLGLFHSGKKTVLSPTRHIEKSPLKGEQSGGKPTYHRHHHHHHHNHYHPELNGSNATQPTSVTVPEKTTESLAVLSPNPQKLESSPLVCIEQPNKRQKVESHQQLFSSKADGTCPLPASSLPPLLLVPSGHLQSENVSEKCLKADQVGAAGSSEKNNDASVMSSDVLPINKSSVTSSKCEPEASLPSPSQTSPVKPLGDLGDVSCLKKSIIPESSISD